MADIGKSAGERYGAPPRKRWAPDYSDAAFVAAKRGQGASWNAIAAMLGRPVADVRARFDKGFDKGFAYGRDRPAVAPALTVRKPGKPRARGFAPGVARGGRPKGGVSVEVLEALRDGLVSAKAIGGRMALGSNAVSSKLGYCVRCGWATAIRPTERGVRVGYAITLTGLAKIKDFREACQ